MKGSLIHVDPSTEPRASAHFAVAKIEPRLNPQINGVSAGVNGKRESEWSLLRLLARNVPPRSFCNFAGFEKLSRLKEGIGQEYVGTGPFNIAELTLAIRNRAPSRMTITRRSACWAASIVAKGTASARRYPRQKYFSRIVDRPSNIRQVLTDSPGFSFIIATSSAGLKTVVPVAPTVE